MDRVSAWMARAALAWLAAGTLVGGLMLADRVVPGEWLRWWLPTHAHMLLVGWLLQFALGIGLWLLPRRRTPERPLGYDERAAAAAAVALNAGLALRLAEPVERGLAAGPVTATLLVLSALLQVVAIVAFVAQLWPRVGPRNGRPRATAAD